MLGLAVEALAASSVVFGSGRFKSVAEAVAIAVAIMLLPSVLIATVATQNSIGFPRLRVVAVVIAVVGASLYPVRHLLAYLFLAVAALVGVYDLVRPPGTRRE